MDLQLMMYMKNDTTNDQYITRDMLTKNSYEGNNFAEDNVVKYDLQNGKINVICFCSDKYM